MSGRSLLVLCVLCRCKASIVLRDSFSTKLLCELSAAAPRLQRRIKSAHGKLLCDRYTSTSGERMTSWTIQRRLQYWLSRMEFKAFVMNEVAGSSFGK